MVEIIKDELISLRVADAVFLSIGYPSLRYHLVYMYMINAHFISIYWLLRYTLKLRTIPSTFTSAIHPVGCMLEVFAPADSMWSPGEQCSL
jgi:hypothetical protein